MKLAQETPDETRRLNALHRLNLLDSAQEERFDRITRFIQAYFNVPIALVSLVDSNRQWFKSKQGLDVCETERSISFCGHAIHHDSVFVVEDTLKDSRFADNPLVTGKPGIRFYAGYPLHTEDDYRIGTLCIIDTAPRRFDIEQQERLRDAGLMVEALIQRRTYETPTTGGGLGRSFFRWLMGFTSPKTNRCCAIGSALLASGAILFLAAQMAQDKAKAYHLNQRLLIQKELEVAAADLESTLSSLIPQSSALAALASVTPYLTAVQFSRFSQSLAQGHDAVYGYALTVNNTLKHAWNRKAADLTHGSLTDILNDHLPHMPRRHETTTLSGPYLTASGEKILISSHSTAPDGPAANAEDTTWINAHSIIDLTALLSAGGSSNIDFDLLSTPKPDAATNQPELSHSESWSTDRGLVFEYRLSLPNYYWTMIARTTSPITTAWPGAATHYTVFAILGGLVGLFIYGLVSLPVYLRDTAKRAMRAKTRSESLFRNAIEAFPYGFVIYDGQGKIATYNQTFADLYPQMRTEINVGTDRETLKERAIELNQVQYTSPAIDLASSLMKQTDIHLTDCRWMRVIETPLDDGSCACFHTDITDLKENEHALSEAMRAAEEANQMKSQFLANISHEVRTPLNGVLGLIEVVLEDNRLPAVQRNHLDVAQKSAQYLLGILNDLLDISRIEAGKITLESKPVDLTGLIDSTLDMVRAESEKKGLTLSGPDGSTQLPILIGDANRIRQILINLLSNAIKFTESGAIKLMVKCDETLSQVQFFISDTGCGINEDQLALIRKPFIQLDTSPDSRRPGTGLGLAICDNLVKSMRGRMDIKSCKGTGTTVTVTLPMPVSGDGTPPPIRAAIVSPDVSTIGEKQIHILLADDGDTNRLVIESMLQDNRFRLTPVTNGSEAVSACKNDIFDVILMDIYMPVVDGMEATRRIRRDSDSINQSTPVIALTANAMEGDKETFIASGMNDYLAKPIKKSDLLNLVEHWAMVTSS